MCTEPKLTSKWHSRADNLSLSPTAVASLRVRNPKHRSSSETFCSENSFVNRIVREQAFVNRGSSVFVIYIIVELYWYCRVVVMVIIVVIMWLRYGLNERGIVVRIPALATTCSVLQNVRTGAEAYSAPPPLNGYGGSFWRIKRSGPEPDLSSESRPEMKNEWNCFHLILGLSWRTAGTVLHIWLLLSSLYPLCRVFIRIFLRQTMSLRNTMLQLFCRYCLWRPYH
jgi:hypothetical protein